MTILCRLRWDPGGLLSFFVKIGRMIQKIRRLLSEFRFWLILNSTVSLALILIVCLSTNSIVESIDSEDRALVDSYSDDLQDLNNLNIELHRYNTDTMAFMLIGDRSLLPRMESRMALLHRMVAHIEATHPEDQEGRELLNRLDNQFAERDNFVHTMIALRESGADINGLARRIYVEGRPITQRLQNTLDTYTDRRFSFLQKSRDDINRENQRERKQLTIIQLVSLAIGILMTVTLGKVLTMLYRRSKHEAEVRREALAIAAHDLKNPISNILGSLELIRSPLGRHSLQDRQVTEIIERAANNMKQLVHDYLEIGKIEAGKHQPQLEMMSVGELIANVIQTMNPLAEQKGHRLVSQLRVLPGEIVVCDPQMLMQVFSNLIGNSLKFSPMGSTIVVQVSRSEQGLQFSVIDNGPGIPEAHRSSVFEKYWQLKNRNRHQGSGLGLSIAKGIVEAHSGKIWVEENANGKGAQFSFTIPVSKLDLSAQSGRSIAP